MNSPYLPPTRNAPTKDEPVKPLTDKQFAELVEKMNEYDSGIRVLAIEDATEGKIGSIYVPDTAKSIKEIGCKRFIVVAKATDTPTKLKNAELAIAAYHADMESAPIQLDVRQVDVGDTIWAPPFAAAKIAVFLSDRLVEVYCMAWGDIYVIQKAPIGSKQT